MDLLNVKVVTWICQSCYLDLSKLLLGFVKLFCVFLVLCQSKPRWSLTKISKLVEASALNWSYWMSLSYQCFGSAVPFAMFFPAYSSSCACASLCSLVMPASLEKWLLPRPNGPTLNVCQIHNHNNNNNENNYRNCDTNGDRCVILNTFFCPTRNSQAIIAYSWNRGF